MENNSNFIIDLLNSQFTSSILGASIGFLGSCFGSKLQIKNNEKEKTIEYLSKNIREFSALRCEIEYLIERYNLVYGRFIPDKFNGRPIEEFSTPKGNYFIIYTSNSSCVGDISEEKTRESIIKTFILAKAIFEEFEINNSFYEEIRIKKLKNNDYSEMELLIAEYSEVIIKDNSELNNISKIAITGLTKEMSILMEKKKIIESMKFNIIDVFKFWG
ncbi:hypothetical protein [Komagataeibacter europaeus]|uniref:hypothetical protein n=1 Tax=Komagataeibacter europaeus TaxID=33995 RepID=UPI002156D7EC|nr:hypothetical protein [Komagataeibacter europaeus]GBQ40830.1 hypothetical protein AA18890_0938 [Komagataeibacter europaeus LMG 18890]